MSVFDKFFTKFSYKFPKGYPDMDNPTDVALLESYIKDLGINFLFENSELISIIDKNIKDYGDLETSGKDTIKLVFSDIPNRGAQSDSLRRDVYDELKALVDREDSLSDFRMVVSSASSLGNAIVNFNGKQYKLVVKGASSDTASDTDVKEALVSLFYITNIDSPFNQDNYEGRINSLIEISNNGIPGETERASQKVSKFLEATSEVSTKNINFINQPLSSALAIKDKYPGQKLIRTGLFDQIRSKAQSITGLPADKWCPGDLYVQLGPVEIPTEDDIELINSLFNEEWGGDKRPLTAISLKQADAQGGKAKALLNKYAAAKDDYNLTKDEIDYDKDQFIEAIEDLRGKVQNLINTNPNIEYDIGSGDLKDEIRFLRGKFAALKSIEFLFRQFENDKVDDAVVALVGFALSLTGVNPTFFKITGQKSGAPGKVDKFSRGQNVTLYNVDGDYDPIEIIDSSTFGGLVIKFKIEKGGEPYSVTINARNNGNTQGTLEVQKIKKIS